MIVFELFAVVETASSEAIYKYIYIYISYSHTATIEYILKAEGGKRKAITVLVLEILTKMSTT